LIRENHNGQIANNLKFLFVEVPLIRLARKLKIHSNSMSTIPGGNLINWLNYIDQSRMRTYFVGE
jgi:hypothetical protein